MGNAAVIGPAEAGMLSPKVVALWRVNMLLWTAAVSIAGVVIGWMLDFRIEAVLAGAAVAGAGFIAAIFWPPARHRSWTFTVGAADVVIRRGVWWRVTSIVPHSRIQHVDTTHGPLERTLGLSSVVLFTAGTVGASIKIPGLPADQADEIRDRLAAVSRVSDSV